MNTTRCKCGCYVPDRCHACGRELGELRNESAELAMLRAESSRLKMSGFLNKAIHEAALMRITELQKALAGQQAIINGRRSGLVEWLREELAVYRGDRAMAAVAMVLVVLLVYALATVAGQLAA